MKKLILTSLILVLVLGCKNSFSTRMTADYFPLNADYKWIFDVKEENNYQITIEVESIEIIEGDSLFNVDVGGETYYFQRKSGTVKKSRKLFTTHEGEKVDFGTVYEPYLFLPPIEGETWEEEFHFSMVYGADTLEKNLSISVDSVRHTSIVVNSHTYENVYKLKRTTIEDNDSIIEYEWLAPNIGLIKKEIPADSLVWELVSFNLNE
jgi:hypothetical protein